MHPAQIYNAGNATDITVIQSLQALNKQHERMAEWNQKRGTLRRGWSKRQLNSPRAQREGLMANVLSEEKPN